jgi:DNA-binding beta-propeller fold protein YncE
MMKKQLARLITGVVLVAGMSTACTHSTKSVSPASAAPDTSATSTKAPEATAVSNQSVPASATPESGGLLPGRVRTGADPAGVAVDTATHTLYVGTGTGISVINDATCDGTTSSGCGQPPEAITFGTASPVALAVDEATDTVYAVNENGGTISVINGATCNASVTTGCGHTPQQVNVGSAPDGVAIDHTTDTVYVANSQDNTISVINGATCNASVATGCSQTPPTISLGDGPQGLAVDELTDTVYVANTNDGTISVIDGATCNATVRTGCTATPPAISLGAGAAPAAVVVDQTTDTVYAVAAGSGLGATWVINGATCNAIATGGCQQVPIGAGVGADPVAVAFDAKSRQVLVLNQGDDSVSIVDGTTCNASVTTGCGKVAPQIATGANPAALGLDTATNTIYVSNQNDDDVSVLTIDACAPDHTAGCRQIPASTSIGAEPIGAAIDSATNTIYVANQDDNDLSVINAATCNALVSSGCATKWTTAATGDNPLAVAVDQATNTVYVANSSPQNNPDGSAQSLDGSTVSVIDGVHCNASITSSCNSASTITVGQGPAALAVDEATNTIYVTNFDDGTVSVINGAGCDAQVTTGCTTSPRTISVGGDVEGIAFDSATGTVYVADTGEDKVSVINAKTCNAQVATGCAQTPAAIGVGKEPRGVAIDIATDTVYVANYADHTVSVINGATCDASITSGCGQHPPTMATGSSPKRGVAVDQATGAVFVDAYYADVIDVFNGETCDSTVTSGCDQQPVGVPAGGQPVSVLVNPATDTVYAGDNADGLLSYFAPPR